MGLVTIATKQEKIRSWLGSRSINIFGRPFAGKDTQCARLASWLQAPVVGGGEILRSQQEAAHLKDVHGGGELVPQDEYIKIITPYLSQEKFAGKPLLLSSVGRWHGEEQPIMEACKAASHPICLVIYIDIGEDDVRKRHALQADRGQRDDDAEHVLDVRLQEFAKKTLPVIDFYEQQGLLIRVDGHHSPDEVEELITDRIYEIAQRS